MKRLKFTALTIMLTALPVCSFAQRNLQKAIDKFVGSPVANGIWKITQDKESESSKDFYYEWGFRLPKSDFKKIDAIRNAFYQDASCSYGLHTKEAGARSESNLIGYGRKLDKQVDFCTHKDRNYVLMFVRDAQDSLRRDVYALVWWKDGSKYEGTLHHISSYDPQRAKWDGDGIVPRNGTKSSRKNNKTVVSSQNGSVTTEADGTTIIKDGNGNKVVVRPDGSVSSISSDFLGPNFLKDSMSGFPFGTSKLTVDDDVLGEFGNLRAAYLNAVREQSDDAVKTGLAQCILRLCKEDGSKLSADEKKLCIASIKEMKDKTYTDEYIRGLFDLCVKALQK